MLVHAQHQFNTTQELHRYVFWHTAARKPYRLLCCADELHSMLVHTQQWLNVTQELLRYVCATERLGAMLPGAQQLLFSAIAKHLLSGRLRCIPLVARTPGSSNLWSIRGG
jgi:hypothetical protein